MRPSLSTTSDHVRRPVEDNVTTPGSGPIDLWLESPHLTGSTRATFRANPKIDGEWAGGSTRRSAAEPGQVTSRGKGQAAGSRVTL
jgi:hypothetical protein